MRTRNVKGRRAKRKRKRREEREKGWRRDGREVGEEEGEERRNGGPLRRNKKRETENNPFPYSPARGWGLVPGLMIRRGRAARRVRGTHFRSDFTRQKVRKTMGKTKVESKDRRMAMQNDQPRPG